MKKVLSIMMALCMLVSVMTAVSVSAASAKVEIIMEQDCADASLGKVTSSGGIGTGWTIKENAAFSGGTAYRSVNDSNYHVTFWPKVDAGWYDVYTYYGWTETVGGWGAGTWKLDNGLGATDKKAPVSLWVNDGLAQSKYSLEEGWEDGWYKIGTVYFSGIYEQDYVQFTRGADMPYVDAIKIKTSDYDPDTIIMDETGVDESIGSVSYTGGSNWTKVESDAYYGGSAMKHPNWTSDYKYSFYPKLEAGWYDVYIYRNWTAWGLSTWHIDNGLNETGLKAPFSLSMNQGKDESAYPTVDGWYKLSTVYFSGVYKQDKIYMTHDNYMPVVDAVKITKSDYNPDEIILDETETTESIKGKVTKSGSWTTTAGDAYYGGSVLKAPNEGSPSVTFQPKLSAGWYEVYTYKNWKIWGTATYAITNGLGLGGNKSDMTGGVNSDTVYPNLKDGWYGLGLVYFSGVYEQDKVTFTRTAGTQGVDAVKFVKADFDPENFIMDEAAIDALPGKVTSNGTWETIVGDQYYGGSVKKHAPYEANYYYTEFYPRVEEGFYTIYTYRNWDIYGGATFTLANGLGLDGVKAEVTGETASTPAYTENGGWATVGTVYFSGIYGQDKVRFQKTYGRFAIDAIKLVKATPAEYEDGVGASDFALTVENGVAKASALLHRSAAEMRDVKLIVAEYNGKELTAVQTTTFDNADIALYAKRTIEASLTLQGSTGSVKAFLWIGDNEPLLVNTATTFGVQ